MATLVMKFGGVSVGSAPALAQVLNIIAWESGRWDSVLVVVSALDGVTDMLLDAAQLARIANQRGYRRIAANLRSRHFAIMEQLPLDRPERSTLEADIDHLLSEMLDHCMQIAADLNVELSPLHSDAVVAIGEKLSARIIAALLRQNGIRCAAVDGTDLLVTDDVFGNANPDLQFTAQRVEQVLRPMLQRDIVPVVTGFIGATAGGETTTLGRGGTDYTASVLCALLEADELWLWTDVDGMMSADPSEVIDARIINSLSYSEAADLAYFGARILHARMIAPLAQQGLPLRIKNIFSPEQTGTLISKTSQNDTPTLKAVTSTQGLALRRPASGSLAGVTRLVGNTLFKTLGMRSEVLIASQSSNSSFLCLVIPTSIGIDGVDRLERALKAKMAEYPEKMPWAIEAVGLVTVIGAGLHSAPQLIAEMLQTLAATEVYGLALGASNCSVTVALPLQSSPEAVRRIHEVIVRSDSDSD
ncbi:MAG: aspartate kinase [Chloroflexi bacterium]|nr:aspartate kinase [Chloroflexota bacterium]